VGLRAALLVGIVYELVRTSKSRAEVFGGRLGGDLEGKAMISWVLRTFGWIALLWGGAANALAWAAPPAFPGALGQGALASGGRGGDVYHVTTLADYDPDAEPKIEGSFRHAVRSAEGPRTIVFDVAGAIALHAPLEIRKNDITVAGQTSPGGVTLWGYPFEVSRAQNVIVRYLRVRLGDTHCRRPAGVAAPAGSRNDLDPGSANAVYVGNTSERVILDHVSAAWGIDETLSVTKARNVTIQNCIIADSFNESLHPKGPHGFGSLVRGEVTPDDQQAGTGGYTFYGNLWAHNRGRNPSFGGQQSLDDGQSEADRRRNDVNMVNCVVYDWGGQATHRNELGAVRANIIGNYHISGPAKNGDYSFRENVPDPTIVYQHGNFQDMDEDADHNGEEVVAADASDAFRDFGDGDELRSEGEPLNFLGDVASHVAAAKVAYQNVLSGAGASLWRDAIDQRVIDSLAKRTGGLINSQEQYRDVTGKLRGIDDLAEQHRPAGFDTDADGMPNAFELAHKLDPKNPADGNATALSTEGYTNLEVYLNELTTGAIAASSTAAAH
jgi:pectate lyase